METSENPQRIAGNYSCLQFCFDKAHSLQRAVIEVSNGELGEESVLNPSCLLATTSETVTEADPSEPSDTADNNIIPSHLGTLTSSYLHLYSDKSHTLQKAGQ